jgi:hypothetical protein
MAEVIAELNIYQVYTYSRRRNISIIRPNSFTWLVNRHWQVQPAKTLCSDLPLKEGEDRWCFSPARNELEKYLI